MLLWLNSCVGLLLPVAMAHMHELQYVMLYAKDSTKEQHVVFWVQAYTLGACRNSLWLKVPHLNMIPDT